MIRTVKLYGHLGKKFGKLHTYDIRTPAEAVRALMANNPGFEKELLNKDVEGYKVIVGDTVYTKDMVIYPADDTIKIVPIVQGAGGDNNIGMIIAGVVLIAAAVILQQYEFIPAIGTEMVAGAAVAEGTLVSAATYSTVAAYAATGMMAVGSALVLSGISGLLFSPTTPAARDGEEQITSTYFNGAVNLTTQGNPVPLIYGRARIGSQVVSAAMLTYKV